MHTKSCASRVVDHLKSIENEYSTGRERCMKSLEAWRDKQGDKASPQQLVRTARYFRLHDLSGELYKDNSRGLSNSITNCLCQCGALG